MDHRICKFIVVDSWSIKRSNVTENINWPFGALLCNKSLTATWCTWGWNTIPLHISHCHLLALKWKAVDVMNESFSAVFRGLGWCITMLAVTPWLSTTMGCVAKWFNMQMLYMCDHSYDQQLRPPFRLKLADFPLINISWTSGNLTSVRSKWTSLYKIWDQKREHHI